MSRKWFSGLKPSRSAPVDLDTGVPHLSRIYDCVLGGQDSFAADQAAVRAAEWRADGEPQPRPSPLEAGGYVAVARKD